MFLLQWILHKETTSISGIMGPESSEAADLSHSGFLHVLDILGF